MNREGSAGIQKFRNAVRQIQSNGTAGKNPDDLIITFQVRDKESMSQSKSFSKWMSVTSGLLNRERMSNEEMKNESFEIDESALKEKRNATNPFNTSPEDEEKESHLKYIIRQHMVDDADRIRLKQDKRILELEKNILDITNRTQKSNERRKLLSVRTENLERRINDWEIRQSSKSKETFLSPVSEYKEKEAKMELSAKVAELEKRISESESFYTGSDSTENVLEKEQNRVSSILNDLQSKTLINDCTNQFYEAEEEKAEFKFRDMSKLQARKGSIEEEKEPTDEKLVVDFNHKKLEVRKSKILEKEGSESFMMRMIRRRSSVDHESINAIASSSSWRLGLRASFMKQSPEDESKDDTLRKPPSSVVEFPSVDNDWENDVEEELQDYEEMMSPFQYCSKDETKGESIDSKYFSNIPFTRRCSYSRMA